MAIKDVCNKDFFPAYRSSGSRPESDIKWIIIHDTEGGTAESIARYFKSRSAGGSAHITVDDVECQRSLANTTIPWAAPGANAQGFHIEMCGFARWTRDEWLEHMPTINRAAYKTAIHAKKFGIPIRYRTAIGLRLGRKGISTHAQVTKAFKQGTHTDPGPNFPLDVFMARVKFYFDQL